MSREHHSEHHQPKELPHGLQVDRSFLACGFPLTFVRPERARRFDPASCELYEVSPEEAGTFSALEPLFKGYRHLDSEELIAYWKAKGSEMYTRFHGKTLHALGSEASSLDRHANKVIYYRPAIVLGSGAATLEALPFTGTSYFGDEDVLLIMRT